MDTLVKINDAKEYLVSKLKAKPEIGIILGSGLGALAKQVEDATVIKYGEIPHFPTSTVPGHAGELVAGKLEGKDVVVMSGRFHFYEGYTMQELVFPVRVMKAIGVKTLIVTNACGGMNKNLLYPGALMFIEDHINFMGSNPLIGKNVDELGPRFPDMSEAYTPELLTLGKKVAADLGVDAKSGVYCAISGPTFMAKAELRMLTGWGADALGMSTVPEVIAAAHMGVRVLGIACVTDMAVADDLEKPDHELVMRRANEAGPKFIKLIRGIVKEV